MTKILVVIGAGVVCAWAVYSLYAAFSQWMNKIDMLDEDERWDYFEGRDVDGLDVFGGDCEP
jgi:hypothetical protein